MEWLILGSCIWVLFGVLAYAMHFAFCMARFPTLAKDPFEVRSFQATSFVAGLLGPMGFVAVFIFTGFGYYGLRFRP